MGILNLGEIQELMDLIFTLHPNRNVAECVLLDLYDKVDLLQKYESDRNQKREARESEGFHTLDPTRRSLLQAAAYLASEEWECDQERTVPTKRPLYHPTTIDMLIRYIKTLSWWGMGRRVHYAATAIGCSLYTYRPHDIGEIVHWAALNIRRTHGKTMERLQERFPHLQMAPASPHKQVDLRPPIPEERAVIAQALACFAPWTRCLTRSPGISLLESHFTTMATSEIQEREQVHAILDPQCAGFQQLVDDYNNALGANRTMPLDPPDTKLGVPAYLPASAGNAPPATNRFQPPALSKDDLERIEYTLAHRRERRKRLRPGRVSVSVDSREVLNLAPQELVRQVFTVPTYASYIQVYGHDAEGPLLLAIFPVPEEDEVIATGEQTLVVTAATGQTITLTILPLRSDSGDVEQYRLQLTYEAAQAATYEPLGDRIIRWLSEIWHPLLAGELVTAADTPPQDKTFYLDAGSIQVTCAWWAAGPGQPAAIRVSWHADITLEGEFWARFTRPDDATVVLAEVPLGSALADEEEFTAQELGFDPTVEPWALALLIRETAR